MIQLESRPAPAPPLPRHRFTLAKALDGGLARAILTAQERWIAACLPLPERRGYRAARLAARRAMCRLEDDHRGTSPAREPVVAAADRDGRAVAVAVPGPARIGIDLQRRRGAGAFDARFFSTPAEVGLAPNDLAVQRALKVAAWDALALSGE